MGSMESVCIEESIVAFAHGIYLISDSHTVLTYIKPGSGPPIIRMHQFDKVLLTAYIVSSDARMHSEVRLCVVSRVGKSPMASFLVDYLSKFAAASVSDWRALIRMCSVLLRVAFTVV